MMLFETYLPRNGGYDTYSFVLSANTMLYVWTTHTGSDIVQFVFSFAGGPISVVIEDDGNGGRCVERV